MVFSYDKFLGFVDFLMLSFESLTHFEAFWYLKNFFGKFEKKIFYLECLILEFCHPLCNGAIHWSRFQINIFQFSSDLDGIQSFSTETFYDCSMLDVWYIWKRNKHSYENCKQNKIDT